MLKPKNFIDLQIENEKRLWRFIDFIEHVLCNPCWNHRKISDTDGNLKGYKNKDHNDFLAKPHHQGGFLRLLDQSPKISNEDMLRWIKDDNDDANNFDHGMTHGFVVAFFYYSLFPNKRQLHDELHSNNYQCSKILYSCLFHDFVKIVYGLEPHDKLLKNFFSNCLRETYEHENPKCQTLLTMADRLDLVRFDDYKEWVDFNKLEIDKLGKDLYYHFFKHIRPAIFSIISNYGDLWMCHSSEIFDMGLKSAKHNVFFPEFFVKPNQNNCQFTISFSKLFSISSVDHENWPRECSDLRSGIFSNGIMGCIPKKKYKKYGEIKSEANRDHFYFNTKHQIPIKEWVFLYSNPDQLREINLNQASLINLNLAKKLCVIIDKIISVVLAVKVE